MAIQRESLIARRDDMIQHGMRPDEVALFVDVVMPDGRVVGIEAQLSVSDLEMSYERFSKMILEPAIACIRDSLRRPC